VTFTPPLALDSHKQPIAGTQTPVVVEGCIVSPRVRGTETTSQDIQGRAQETIAAGLTVYPPPGTPTIGHRYTATVEGHSGTWQVDGNPVDWTSPLTGWNPGGEIILTRAGG
jgi:hypothetical protein